jgi:hypothetical protein
MSIRRYANTDAQEETLVLLEKLCKANDIPFRYGTSVGKAPQTIIFDISFQGNEIRIGRNGYLAIGDGTKEGFQIPRGERPYEQAEEDVGIDIQDNEEAIVAALKRAKAHALAQEAARHAS